MNLGWVASVPEVIGAFLGSEGSKDFANCGADALDGARGGFTQQVLEFREDLFDGVQVWRVLRQEEQFGPGRADELPHGFALVTAEIVHDDDVAFAQRRHQDTLDVGSKALAIDRPLISRRWWHELCKMHDGAA